MSNIIRYQKNYCKLSDNSLPMITKQQIPINYIKEISLKNDANYMKYYQMPKKLFYAFGQFSCHDHKTTK